MEKKLQYYTEIIQFVLSLFKINKKIETTSNTVFVSNFLQEVKSIMFAGLFGFSLNADVRVAA